MILCVVMATVDDILKSFFLLFITETKNVLHLRLEKKPSERNNKVITEGLYYTSAVREGSLVVKNKYAF